MHAKNLLKTALIILGMVHLSAFSEQYYSGHESSALIQNNASEIHSSVEHQDSHTDMQNCISGMCNKKTNKLHTNKTDHAGMEWNSALQPYIEAHRQYKVHS